MNRNAPTRGITHKLWHTECGYLSRTFIEEPYVLVFNFFYPPYTRTNKHTNTTLIFFL